MDFLLKVDVIIAYHKAAPSGAPTKQEPHGTQMGHPRLEGSKPLLKSLELLPRESPTKVNLKL